MGLHNDVEDVPPTLVTIIAVTCGRINTLCCSWVEKTIRGSVGGSVGEWVDECPVVDTFRPVVHR